MIYYSLMMILAVAFTFIEMAKPNDARLKQSMLNASSAIAIVAAGFRDGVGADWNAYLCYHSLAGHMPLAAYIQANDPGYMLLGWLFARAGLGVWATNLICAIMLVSGILHLASRVRFSNMFFLAALPYLIIIVGMGYSRQSAAIGMICHALGFLIVRSGRMALLTAMASLAFHKSAAFGIAPILATYGRKLWMRIAVLIIIAPVVIFLVVLEGYAIAQRAYIEAEYQSAGALIRILQIFLCGAWFILFLKPRFNSEPHAVFTASALFSIFALPALLASPSSTLIDRLGLYLLPFQCYVLARTPEVFSKGASRQIVQAGIILINVAIFGVWMTSAQNLESWMNYKNFLWSGSPFGFQFFSC